LIKVQHRIAALMRLCNLIVLPRCLLLVVEVSNVVRLATVAACCSPLLAIVVPADSPVFGRASYLRCL
jgi:hypothetical protein